VADALVDRIDDRLPVGADLICVLVKIDNPSERTLEHPSLAARLGNMRASRSSWLARRSLRRFIDHFQELARAHFVVRRLERRYGKSAVRAAYERFCCETEAAA
jgi:hypothetical protein